MKDLDRKNNNKSGSLKNSEPEFLVAGKLRKSHGLNGEMYLIKTFQFLLAKNLRKTKLNPFEWQEKWD
jgi:hypothetical protein